jgi:hypothetical protein
MPSIIDPVTKLAPIFDYDDPNRIVKIELKASDVWKIETILCLMSAPRGDHQKLILEIAKATTLDMERIHRRIYFAEMGWIANDL